jgi:hypothetical protein
MTKFTRKFKVELEQLANNEETIAITITIDSNHINSNLDNFLMSLTNVASNFNNYKIKVEEKKEKKEPKKPKKKQFGGNFV